MEDVRSLGRGRGVGWGGGGRLERCTAAASGSAWALQYLHGEAMCRLPGGAALPPLGCVHLLSAAAVATFDRSTGAEVQLWDCAACQNSNTDADEECRVCSHKPQLRR